MIISFWLHCEYVWCTALSLAHDLRIHIQVVTHAWIRFFFRSLSWFSLLLKIQCNPFIVIKLYLCIEWKVIKYSLSVCICCCFTHAYSSRYLPSRMAACNYLNLHYDSHCIHFCCADVVRLSKCIFCSHLFRTKFISLFVLTWFYWYQWPRSECLFHLSILISLLFVLWWTFFSRRPNAGHLFLASDSNRLCQIFFGIVFIRLDRWFHSYSWHWILSLDKRLTMYGNKKIFIYRREEYINETHWSPAANFTTYFLKIYEIVPFGRDLAMTNWEIINNRFRHRLPPTQW